ncbi:GNAT family N-acetyltransferase [Coprococcus sp. AF16-22]|uniref:GNAT family N-acetyltransferase n=2 Tax=Coprococcus TaxID=33042 RepID=UPI002E8DCDCC|nr:GNAT family N-acetyltransferase [Coprococcus sp. AF16-22]
MYISAFFIRKNTNKFHSYFIFEIYEGICCPLEYGLARVLDDSELVAFVHYVLVHPEYQGQKIAGNMVEYIRDKYKNYLYIEGMQEDSKNVAFYERHGFHVMEGGTPIQICNFSDKR